ncbi:hypothetical protein [uncultured Candidatus Kuenenia sp.]|nr:hypothetical protein [uncultured Candidatus Kuenenia sp.]
MIVKHTGKYNFFSPFFCDLQRQIFNVWKNTCFSKAGEGINLP